MIDCPGDIGEQARPKHFGPFLIALTESWKEDCKCHYQTAKSILPTLLASRCRRSHGVQSRLAGPMLLPKRKERQAKGGQRPRLTIHYCRSPGRPRTPGDRINDQKAAGFFRTHRLSALASLKSVSEFAAQMRKVGDAGRFSREVHLFKQVAVALVAAQAIHMRIDLQEPASRCS